MSLPRPRHLVTGATSGVGRATARRLAAGGASVLVHARTQEKGTPVLEEIRRETGSEALGLVTGDSASWTRSGRWPRRSLAAPPSSTSW